MFTLFIRFAVGWIADGVPVADVVVAGVVVDVAGAAVAKRSPVIRFNKLSYHRQSRWFIRLRRQRAIIVAKPRPSKQPSLLIMSIVIFLMPDIFPDHILV